MTKDRDELLDHNYDGIQEYDNDLPRWWVWLFIITVVWGGVYAVWFHSQATPTEQLTAEMQALEALRSAQAAAAPAPASEDSLLALARDGATLKRGGEIYAAKCLACHGAAGEGLVGPNLTDDHWIHGGKITDIKNVVLEGVLDKGMIAWKSMMSGEEIDAVVAFVWSLHGTNPPNAKAPQGESVPRT